MNTNKLFAVIAGLLVVLTSVAMIWRPDRTPDHKTRLIWTSDNNPARTEQIATFNREQPDLLLELDYSNQSTQKVVLQSISGVGPDILDFQDRHLQALVEAGVLMDLTAPAKELGFSAARDSWPAGADVITLNARQYAYPCNIGANILIYNKNVFDYFGVPYPEGLMTVDEFIELAKKVNSPRGTDPSKRIFAVAELNWEIFFESQRGEFFTEDGRLNIADSPELRRAIQLHKDLIFRHHLMPTTIETKNMSGQGGWGLGSLNQFAAGRFAMIAAGEWALIGFQRTYQHQIASLEKQGIQSKDIADPLKRPLRLGAVLIPRFSEMAPCYRVMCRLAGINSQSPRRNEALAFFPYLAGASYSHLINTEADFLPGNPKYVDFGLKTGSEDLSRLEMHRITKQAVGHGYALRRSPFLLTSDITYVGRGVLDAQINRLESDPSLSVEGILQSAQRKLEALMRRNLERNPELKQLYRSRFGEAGIRELEHDR